MVDWRYYAVDSIILVSEYDIDAYMVDLIVSFLSWDCCSKITCREYRINYTRIFKFGNTIVLHQVTITKSLTMCPSL